MHFIAAVGFIWINCCLFGIECLVIPLRHNQALFYEYHFYKSQCALGMARTRGSVSLSVSIR